MVIGPKAQQDEAMTDEEKKDGGDELEPPVPYKYSSDLARVMHTFRLYVEKEFSLHSKLYIPTKLPYF